MNAPRIDWNEFELFKLRVSDFQMLDRAGVFDGRYKVELIEGVIVAMNAEYRLHGVVKNRLVRRLQTALEQSGSALEALAEVTVKLDENSLPQPDAMIARVSVDRRYFGPEDLAMVIEVADSTVRTDLGPKVALYASAGIPELWVADLRPAQLHQYWAPADGLYTRSRTVFLLGKLESLTIGGLAIDGDGIL